MASTLIKRFMARHALGWICLGAAILGILVGAALSIPFLERPEAARLEGAGRIGSVEIALPVLRSAPAESITSEPGREPAGSSIAPQGLSNGADQPVSARELQPATRSAQGQDLAAPLDQTGLLRTDFDLGDTKGEMRAIEIRKPIHLDGRAIGVASLSIDRHSRLRVSSEDLGKLLPAELYARVETKASHIGFDELRDAGLDVRYDPLADAIQIRS